MKRPIRLALVVVCAMPFLCGCSRPQVKPQNRVLIKALRTAVNTKQSDWLEKAAARVEASFQAGEMEDEEHAEFLSIIDTARNGRWQEAEEEVLRLAWAQRPTDEEIRRLEKGRHHDHQHWNGWPRPLPTPDFPGFSLRPLHSLQMASGQLLQVCTPKTPYYLCEGRSLYQLKTTQYYLETSTKSGVPCRCGTVVFSSRLANSSTTQSRL